MKALSIRLDDQLNRQFNEACKKAGYKKNTLVSRLIASFVRHQKQTKSSRQKVKDPFAEVIGLLKQESFFESGDEIDKIVYHL